MQSRLREGGQWRKLILSISVHHENNANLGHMDLREKKFMIGIPVWNWIHIHYKNWNQFSTPYINLIPRPVRISNGPGNETNHTCVSWWRSNHLCITNFNQHFHLLLSGGLVATTPTVIQSTIPIAQSTPALTINEYVKHPFCHVILPTREWTKVYLKITPSDACKSFFCVEENESTCTL